MLQINKRCVPKQFPDITETLESHDPNGEKLNDSKVGKPGLVEILL